MVTDRQDLDGQLFGVFNDAGDLLGESPKQANSIKELKDYFLIDLQVELFLLLFRSSDLKKTKRNSLFLQTDTSHRYVR